MARRPDRVSSPKVSYTEMVQGKSRIGMSYAERVTNEEVCRWVSRQINGYNDVVTIVKGETEVLWRRNLIVSPLQDHSTMNFARRIENLYFLQPLCHEWRRLQKRRSSDTWLEWRVDHNKGDEAEVLEPRSQIVMPLQDHALRNENSYFPTQTTLRMKRRSVYW